MVKNLFEHPKITVDIVIFTVVKDVLYVLLIQRKYPPFQNRWALPGGFIRKGEEVEHAARRELFEETGVFGAYLEQLYTFGAPRRDPRGRVITVAYVALMPRHTTKLKASYDAKSVKLFPVKKLPKAAFDHKKIIHYALVRLRNKIQYSNAAWSLLPEFFTLGDIQRVYEIIWKKKVDKRNFRKKFLSLGLLRPLSRIVRGMRRRPARLYAFKTTCHVELERFFKRHD